MRHIYQNLRDQVYRALVDGHDHEPFKVTGTGCMLCRLLDRNEHPLAMLQMARQSGMSIDWLPAERELYELVGETAFKKRIEDDIEYIKNLPKLQCRNCMGRTVLFMTIKELAFITLRNSWRHYAYSCEECGNKLYVKKEDIPEPLMEAMRRRILIAQRKHRLKKQLEATMKKKIAKKLKLNAQNAESFNEFLESAIHHVEESPEDPEPDHETIYIPHATVTTDQNPV